MARVEEAAGEVVGDPAVMLGEMDDGGAHGLRVGAEVAAHLLDIVAAGAGIGEQRLEHRREEAAGEGVVLLDRRRVDADR